MLYLGIGVILILILLVLAMIRSSFLYISIAINLPTLPLALFMSVMGSDAPDSTLFDSLFGFLLIQGIPLLILITNIVLIIKNRLKTKKENQLQA